MISYQLLISLHVVTAVVGVGLIGAIPIVAASARGSGGGALAWPGALEAIFRYARVSLAVMLVSGALIEYVMNGAFHTSGWFRASFALLVFLGFSLSRTQRTFRKGKSTGGDVDRTLQGVVRWGLVMCGTVALITVLMEVKPF